MKTMDTKRKKNSRNVNLGLLLQPPASRHEAQRQRMPFEMHLLPVLADLDAVWTENEPWPRFPR